MRLFLPIIACILITLSGLAPAFGFGLYEGGKANSVNRWPYSFGDRYIYDNTGSRWNYDSGHPSHNSNQHHKYWQPRFEYDYKVEGHTNEEFQDLIEHLSEDNIHHIKPYHHEGTYHHDPSCR